MSILFGFLNESLKNVKVAITAEDSALYEAYAAKEKAFAEYFQSWAVAKTDTEREELSRPWLEYYEALYPNE